MSDWRNECEVGWKDTSRYWVRWTDPSGIYWWLHPVTRKWIGEPNQITMPDFPTSAAAYQAIRELPEEQPKVES